MPSLKSKDQLLMEMHPTRVNGQEDKPGRFSTDIYITFQNEFERVLTVKERQTLELLIDGRSEKSIAIRMNKKESSVKRMVFEILDKFRNGLGHRVDNNKNQILPKCPNCSTFLKEVSPNLLECTTCHNKYRLRLAGKGLRYKKLPF